MFEFQFPDAAPQQPQAPEGTMLVSSSMIPPQARDPLAFIDSSGHVLPHEAGRELQIGVTYLFTREEVMAAMAEQEAMVAARRAATTQSALPNLHQGRVDPTHLTQAEIDSTMESSKRDLVGMLTQFKDPAGKAVQMPRGV